MSYYVDSTKHFKIWFSQNPESFLGIENQLRLIRMRHNNPHISITFIYSSACLSRISIQLLKTFCAQHQIIPFDFDRDVQPLLSDHQDKALYQIAQQEIEKARSNEGGNMAAASDCARLMLPIIKKGIYSDFDVSVKMDPKKRKLKVKSPFMLPIEQHLNTDTIVVANDEKVHADAVATIRAMQRKIIENYTNAHSFAKSLLEVDIPTSRLSELPVVTQFIERYLEENQKPDIICFRKKVSNLNPVDYFNTMSMRKKLSLFGVYQLHTISEETLIQQYADDLYKRKNKRLRLSPEQYLQKVRVKINAEVNALKQILLKSSVCNITGPFAIYMAISQSKIFNDDTFEKMSLRKNKIDHYFDSSNTYRAAKAWIKKHPNANLEERAGQTGDISWTPIGQSNLNVRGSHIERAITTIQSHIRIFLARTPDFDEKQTRALLLSQSSLLKNKRLPSVKKAQFFNRKQRRLKHLRP